ncbi:MAG: LysM peptidoglycan-binding domain-containing protein [Chitinophagaceae bacterium]|nr:MAG: LysM peptidoglycan-binding domain-containing protein [Chitinophagaceae bacterium]
MKKYLFLVITLFCAVTFSDAQSRQDTLVVVPGKQGMYFYQVVTKEETLYSLSRKYHIEPKELADFNHLTLKSQLQLFQLVKIPLNKENFDQTSATNIADAIPLYHRVLKGETLYHISQLHDKVSDALLQKWNGLTGNEVKTGQYLIVGWLKTGETNARVVSNKVAAHPAQSSSEVQPDATAGVSGKAPSQQEKMKDNHANALANSNISNHSGNSSDSGNGSNINNHSHSNNAFLSEVIASENASRNIHTSSAPVDEDNNAFAVNLHKTNAADIKDMPKVQKPKKEIKPVPEKKESAKKEPIKKEKITLQPEKAEKPDSFDLMLTRVTQVSKNNATPRPAPSVIPQASEQNPDKPAPPPTTQIDEAAETVPASSVASEFGQQYEQQTSNGAHVDIRKGAAGWFKSNVKPGSGRYYALCNDLPRGTIVKVVNPLNKKSILVKILDVIPKGAENYNLIIKISDAAMEDLGITQSRFWCEIQYPKQ